MGTIKKHGDLVHDALAYILEAKTTRPETSLNKLLDEAGMRFNLTPLDAESLRRLLQEEKAKNSL